jgi:hypothetical protein
VTPEVMPVEKERLFWRLVYLMESGDADGAAFRDRARRSRRWHRLTNRFPVDVTMPTAGELGR